MKNKLFVLYIILVSIISVAYFLQQSNNLIEEKKIPARFIYSATEHGFDLEKNVLSFGVISINESASRKISLNNTFNKKVRITITVAGNISSYIISPENNFYLNPKEEREIPFSVFAPQNNLYGTYTGIVTIQIKRG